MHISSTKKSRKGLKNVAQICTKDLKSEHRIHPDWMPSLKWQGKDLKMSNFGFRKDLT